MQGISDEKDDTLLRKQQEDLRLILGEPIRWRQLRMASIVVSCGVTGLGVTGIATPLVDDIVISF